MTDTFEIKSTTDATRVQLKATSRGFIAVAVTSGDLVASAEVAHLGGGDGIRDYWADLAKNWRGWRGEKAWGTVEGDLILSATSDRTGHVTLVVTLAHGAPWTWRTEAIVAIEAGQLERLAAVALAFARHVGAAT
jgi:hypothetical protein